ncbi:LysR family transcriptional regulator [Nonomuraea sp. B12E4]|uniref:LysR family transcriptional regulator n=1 Tax=Nonomuraea sp. B12E4 TaxID=3153564 RepID=UPI00325E6036
MAFGMPHLKAFVAVADAGGFSAAATDLGVSQSAVSHSVASLERALGAPVLSRGPWAQPTAPAVTGVELASDGFCALLPRDHPLAGEATVNVSDLEDDPFILSKGGCEKHVRDAYRKAAARFVPAHQVRDMTTLLTMVRSGIGVSIVPELTRAMLDERLSLVPLVPRVTRRLVLAGPEHRPWQPAVTALLDSCRLRDPVTGAGPGGRRRTG